ncbi:LCP family protein [Actinokineospora globicatena]|uniref:LCP family glycopolymer transferase n=1 Tax=Actinokineospora globicatena TaxID=103729 RepID=UPI0020A3A31E|nr:LCP family protein [Actinokineospora globicatena]MCP2301535.1 transcriptional attenuator, LytR family [Actinokineospora globicatena]GLW76818.1 hypothetical protein Aglo01_13000 [Actinokineospora globicatena]GLW83651.1 hypothetical protein Aglo02_12910 [Actinokineospora globicatena]
MSDDHDRAPGSSPGGKRRAPEPAEQPRRRRRSMEGAGGVSVSDLVERHSGSRSNLMPIPEADEPDEVPRHQQGGRRAAPEPPARHSAAQSAADDAPDVHRNTISSGGRRSAPEVPAPEPEPYRPEPPRAEPPRVEQPRPESRRGRTATHSVPADILAQSKGQPVERPARPVRDEVERPTSVADLLGPTAVGKRAKKETFAESASRGRADARRSLPGNPPPPPARHTDEQPIGRRARVEPEADFQEPTRSEPRRAPEPAGRPELPRRNRQDAAAAEPAPRSEPPRQPRAAEPIRRQDPALGEPIRAERQGRGPAQPPVNDRRPMPEPSRPDRRLPESAIGEPNRSEPLRPNRPLPDSAIREPNRSEPLRPNRPLPDSALREPTRSEPQRGPNGGRRGPAHPVGTPDFPLDERQAGPFSENRPPSPGRRGPQEPLGRRQPQPSGQFPIADQGRRGPDERAPMGQGRPRRQDDADLGGPLESPRGTGSHPAPGRRPMPGPTGQHPIPDLPGRPGGQPVPNGPAPTGAHPIPGRPNGGRGVEPPHATGSHPVPNGNRRPQPEPGVPGRTGAHPIPSPDARRPGPDGRTGAHPIPNGPAPTGAHPIPGPVDHGQRGPGPDMPGRPGFRGGPLDGPQGTGAHPIPGRGEPHDGPGRLDSPHGTGSHPIPGRPLDTPQGTGSHPVPRRGESSGGHPVVEEQQPKPRIPSQQPPGQSSMPPVPEGKLTPPAGVSPQELAGLTTEMEPIGEAVQKRRRVDQTLARFSKVHDEMRAEEKAKKSKRIKTPWGSDAAELDDKLDELAAMPAEPTVVVEPVDRRADSDGAGPDDDDDKPKRGRWSLLAKVFSGSAAVAVFAATGVGWGVKEWADNAIEQVRALDPESESIQNAAGQRGDENFLLVGSDSREGAEAEEGVGNASAVPGARSDTVMIAHIPADRSRVVIVSFPRDLEINRPGCERFDAKAAKYTGEHVQPLKNAKMNTAYQVGGPLCVTRVVQELSGLQITRFVGIDFTGFRGMVDAVDGVNVCVEQPMFDTKLNKWIVKEAGTEVMLRGEQALDFVRARHVRGDPTSDYGRIKRQQRFLSSLLRKAMSGQVLLDPSKLTTFTGEVAKSTFGDNIGVDSLMQLGQSLQNLETGRVTFITVPTVGTSNSRGNEVLRKDDADRLFRAIINKEPLSGEAPPPPATEGGGTQQQAAPLREPVDPKTLKVQVLNGGNETGGIARRTAEKLEAFGFTVVQVNPTAPVARSVVRYGKGHEAAAQTLASTVPGATLQEDPSMSAALVLVIGPEFTGQIVAPGTPGAQTPTPNPQPLPDLSTVNGSDVTCA